MSHFNIIRLNQIYRKLDQQEYPHWKIPQEHELFSLLKIIGKGTFQPTETQIRKYHLARQEFRLDFLDSIASLSAIALPETNIPQDPVTIYTDESVALGINLLRLKKVLELEPKETNFEIINKKNHLSLIKSRFIHEKYLDLQIGSHLLKFRYGLNQSEEVILLYPTKYNNQTIDRFESANVWLKQLNERYIYKCIVYSKLIAAIKINSQKSKTVFDKKRCSKLKSVYYPVSPIQKSSASNSSMRSYGKKLQDQNLPDAKKIASTKTDSIVSSVSSPLKRKVEQPPRNALLKWISKLWEFFNSNDFSGIDLSNADLVGQDFCGSDFSRANLSGANLYVVDLSDTNLSGANLSGADLSYANLNRANLSGADLSDTNLNEANLSGANLSDTNLSRANLSGADVSDTDFDKANLGEADLSKTENARLSLL